MNRFQKISRRLCELLIELSFSGRLGKARKDVRFHPAKRTVVNVVNLDRVVTLDEISIREKSLVIRREPHPEIGDALHLVLVGGDGKPLSTYAVVPFDALANGGAITLLNIDHPLWIELTV
jgi:hypothetical protein